MSKRLLSLRKKLKLSQTEFGKKLGVGATAISKLEKGDRNLTEQMIKSICREYNVNYFWLTEGTGEMFNDADADAIAIIDEIMCGEDSVARSAFVAASKLKEKDWVSIRKFINLFHEEEKKRKEPSE